MTADATTPTEYPEYHGLKNLVWLRDAFSQVFPDGYQPSEATVTRWINRGVLTSKGKRTTLFAVKLGGRYATSISALQLFLWSQHQGAKTAEGELAAVPGDGGEMFAPPADQIAATELRTARVEELELAATELGESSY